VEESVEPTAESMSLGEEAAGQPMEAEPPIVSGHGMSFWMFIVVCLCSLAIPLSTDLRVTGQRTP